MKKVLLGIMGASALVLSTASLAGGPDVIGSASVAPTQQTGVYVSAGAGYGYQDSFFDKQDGFAWIASLGYQFSPYFAAELGYFDLPNATTSFSAPGFSEYGKLKTSAIYMAGKGILPVNDNFDVFVKAGIARMDTTLDVSATDFMGTQSVSAESNELVFLGGVGADYYVTQSLAITVQGLATLKGSNTPATYLATAGLSYKFAV